MDLRDSYRGRVIELPFPFDGLTLGVVDASRPGVAEGISRLLFRSIDDARSSKGGHLPDWLVTDIENNYICPEKVRTLWAPFGHRFCVMRDGEIVGTVHVGASSDTILTVDRDHNNVRATDYPGFKPAGHHHMVNLSVLHELRRARLGTAMIDGVMREFRELFDGVGIWVRGDPPWHVGLRGLGFVHDPSMDIYLPASVEKTSGMSHFAFNALHHCACGGERAIEREKKLQYVSFTRPFASVGAGVSVSVSAGVSVGASVSAPRSIEEVVGIVAGARRIVVRGQQKNNSGVSDGDSVLCTSELCAIGDVRDGAVTVGAGVTWAALAERGLFPPVITGWPSASVGGTLSSGGFSKGSGRYGFQIDHVRSLVVVTGDGRRVECSVKQAGWLFEAVLGGLGCFGVIVEATLELGKPISAIDVGRTEEPPPLDADSWHVTSFRKDGKWTVVRANPGTDKPFVDYVSPKRDETRREESWLHMLLPPTSVRAYCEAFTYDVQVLAIRQQRAHRSLVQTLPGDIAHAVLIHAPANTGLYPLLELGQSLGGKSLLAGTLPRNEAEWRAHLGETYEPLIQTKRTADPHRILGASVLGQFGAPPRRTQP